MTISVNDFHKIEDGIRYVLDHEYGDRNNHKVDDVLQAMRGYLKDRRVRIEGSDPCEVPIVYPVQLILPDKSKIHAATSMATKAKKAQEARVLTEDQVLEIRASDLTGVALAKQYGVSDATISGIRNRKSYAEV